MKEKIKRLYKPFILIFLISFLIINWNDISFLFNYRVIYAKLSDLFEKSKPQAIEATNNNYFEKENSIEIPKIGIEAPIVFAEEGEDDFKDALKRGVLLHPESVLPGEQGTTIILGHSAPPGWPKINYDWVFSDLNTLERRDEFHVYFNHRQFSYKVRKKFFLKRGEEVPSSDLTNSKSMVILLSCWPPGKDQERIAIQAELII
ncbi:sortase [Patescibacteria group bacterium]|nr:sortase [Patescibacteria group bacterium]